MMEWIFHDVANATSAHKKEWDGIVLRFRKQAKNNDACGPRERNRPKVDSSVFPFNVSIFMSFLNLVDFMC